jgi:lysophospholipase L1-like esterase
MWNKSFLCFLLCLSLGSCGNRSEKTAVVSGYAVSEDSVSVAINGNVPVSGVWDAGWLHRYAADVEELAAKAAADQRKDIDVVFFGSSSIRLWNGLEEMMAPLSVVNRGYGGATVRDILVNYDKLMAHYSPKAFVVFCDNDICGNEVDLTVSGVLDHYRLLFNRLDQDYPGVPVFFLSWKYSGLRAFMRDTQKLVNDVMADYASSSNQVTFVDVNATLLQPDGDINQSLFESDNLHINRDGYLLWTSVLKPLLLEVCEK